MGLFLAALVPLLLGGWLRAAGSAVSQIPRADAHHDAAEGIRGARMMADLLDDRNRISPAVGMVGSALLVGAAIVAVVAVERIWSDGALAVAVVVAALAVVMVGDVLPRLLGRSRSRFVAYRSAPLVAAAVRVGGWAAERPVDDNGNGGPEEDEEHDEDELALISSVLEFSETIVREVMVPRLDMVTVDASADADVLAAAATEHGFSRFPVSEGDDIVGLLLVKDLLPCLSNGADGVTARMLMRPSVFVPEVKQIADLLSEMRASKTHMAIVVDEFGEIAGLVTIEDLLEELVGEIVDETDDEEIWVEPLGEGTWRVDARLAVEDLGELLGAELPEGDWDTVAGLILGLAERVPEEDESFDVDDAALTVARMQGRRVAEVIV
ncbi:MAG: hemolysin family protein, partial [Acidimicrobiia bacterium]